MPSSDDLAVARVSRRRSGVGLGKGRRSGREET
jgi:hypothetical protein